MSTLIFLNIFLLFFWFCLFLSVTNSLDYETIVSVKDYIVFYRLIYLFCVANVYVCVQRSLHHQIFLLLRQRFLLSLFTRLCCRITLRSPNLTSPDFILWDLPNDLVYNLKLKTIPELKEAISKI